MPQGGNNMQQTPLDNQARPSLWKLFYTTLLISAFTFGGGFVIVTLLKRKMVDELKWVDEKEMLDMVALAQSAPGPIAVNAGILVGWKVAGARGMAVSVLGTVLPPLVILSLISALYSALIGSPAVAAVFRGMQAGVAAVIADVVLGLGRKVAAAKDPWQILVMAAAFVAAYFFKINVMLIVLAAAGLGCARALFRRGARA